MNLFQFFNLKVHTNFKKKKKFFFFFFFFQVQPEYNNKNDKLKFSNFFFPKFKFNYSHIMMNHSLSIN